MQPILTLKTKQPQRVTTATNRTENVYFDFLAWHRTPAGYIAEFLYYFLETTGIGEEQTTTKVQVKDLAVRREVDFATANAIASQISSQQTGYVEKETDFLTGGSLAIINGDKHWNLTAADWEVVQND